MTTTPGAYGPAVTAARRRLPGRAAVLAALLGLAAALVLGLPSPAAGADAPAGLEDMVASVVRENAEGPVAWARYVETTPEVVAELLGTRRDRLSDAVPERVHLVVLHGDFTMPGAAEGRGPYLAFLYWRSRDTWEATDFTLLERAPPLRDAGDPQPVAPFALTHPTLDRLWLDARVYLLWFGPPVLLALCAVLCLWKRGARWPSTLGAGAAVAVALWQVSLTVSSMAGQAWDPAFHGVKLAVVAVVLTVDMAAVILLLRRRPAPTSAVLPHGGRAPRPVGGAALLLTAAVLYVPSLFWLATTGA